MGLLAPPTVLSTPPGVIGSGNPEASPAHVALSDLTCEDGHAGDFQCQRADLLAYLPLDDMQCNTGNDIWGWTDPDTGSEYALMGCDNGTSFVDITDPIDPVYIGRLPTHTGNSPWRDIKVHDNHAFVVADFAGAHGMQVFDLTRLRTATPPATFNDDAWYGNVGSAHNVAINKETGYAYIVGVSSGDTTCGGGLHIVNIQQPQNPQFEGCFSSDGYTHDAQCVIYQGPDSTYQGREICFNSNPAQGSPANTLTIVDVTDKQSPALISATPYTGSAYAHQGWLTEDHQYFLFGDELDEGNPATEHTMTYIWDVRDLSSPEVIGVHESGEIAIDHNQFVKGNFLYQSNYTAGLRILDLSDVAEGELTETAYFHVIPHQHVDTPSLQHDEIGGSFNGTWSNYPFFDSGVVIASTIGESDTPGGLFVVLPRLAVVTGVVTRDDTGEVLEGAGIEVSGSGQWQGQTDSDGDYSIDTAAGEIQVTASKDGFPDSDVEQVMMVEGEQTQVDFALTTPPGLLQSVPDVHDFGEVDAGQVSQPLEVMLTNAVSEPARALEVASIAISGDEGFEIGATGSCDTQTVLAPGQSCTIELSFGPEVSGDYQATLHVESEDGQSATVVLSGKGLPSEPAELALEPEQLIFEDTFTGQSRTLSLTLSNVAEGDAMDLVLTRLEVLAGGAQSFVLDSGTCASSPMLSPGQSCIALIEFTPVDATIYSGVLRVGSEDEQVNVSLSGRGVEPPPIIFDDRFEDEPESE